jgi:hypothetical protein
MALNVPSLERWYSVPQLARELETFLESPTGRQLLATIHYEFRARSDSELVVPGVDYIQVQAITNAKREGVQKLVDTIQQMSVVKEPKQRIKDEGWAMESLRREDDPVPARKPSSKPKK